MKCCRRCGVELEIGRNWSPSRAKHGVLICVPCNNIPLKERRKKHRAQLAEIKHNKGCVVCGENRPPCLDFHAPDGHTNKCLSRMVKAGVPWTKIEAEIKRCVVVCANCHRLIHAGEIEL